MVTSSAVGRPSHFQFNIFEQRSTPTPIICILRQNYILFVYFTSKSHYFMHLMSNCQNYIICYAFHVKLHYFELSVKNPPSLQVKWEEVTDYPRPSALALSEPFLPSHCLFVCRQIYRAKLRCSFVAWEQIRRRRVNRPFLRLNLTTLLGAPPDHPCLQLLYL